MYKLQCGNTRAEGKQASDFPHNMGVKAPDTEKVVNTSFQCLLDLLGPRLLIVISNNQKIVLDNLIVRIEPGPQDIEPSFG